MLTLDGDCYEQTKGLEAGVVDLQRRGLSGILFLQAYICRPK